MEANELILALHAPDWTPEFEALHQRILTAHEASDPNIDAILAECVESECIVCGAIICPFHEPLHFHHDGCPCCDMVQAVS